MPVNQNIYRIAFEIESFIPGLKENCNVNYAVLLYIFLGKCYLFIKKKILK